jgi:hypothetical protein
MKIPKYPRALAHQYWYVFLRLEHSLVFILFLLQYQTIRYPIPAPWRGVYHFSNLAWSNWFIPFLFSQWYILTFLDISAHLSFTLLLVYIYNRPQSQPFGVEGCQKIWSDKESVSINRYVSSFEVIRPSTHLVNLLALHPEVRFIRRFSL